MKNTLFVSFVTVFSILSAQADEAVKTHIHNFYQSPRAMGMGNAFTAVSDDYAGLFYNPSALSFRTNGEIQFSIISAAFTANAPTMFKDIDDAGKTEGSDSDKATAISNVLEKYYGKPVGARISPIEYIWVRPNWGLALVVADISIDSMVQRQVGPSIDLNVIKDTCLSYGYSKLINSDMSVGALAKFNHRSQLSGSYSSLDLAVDSNVVDFKKSNEGINIDFDIGYTWKPSWAKPEKKKREVAQEEAAPEATPEVLPEVEVKKEEPKKNVVETQLKPEEIVQPVEVKKNEAEMEAVQTTTPPAEVKSIDDIDTTTDGIQIRTRKIVADEDIEKPAPLTFSAVLRNLLSMKYSKTAQINKDAVEGPKANDRVIDLGVAYDLYQGDFSTVKVVGEAKNLMHKEASLNKCLHLGAEYTIYSSDWLRFQVRAGLNQMYYTAGFGMLLGVLDIQAVTYGEEYGTDSLKIENRVNAVSLGLKF